MPGDNLETIKEKRKHLHPPFFTIKNMSSNNHRTTNNNTIDNESLHDWLENDLKQFKENTSPISKCSLKHIISQDSNPPHILSHTISSGARNDTLLEKQQQSIPVIKVYSLLNSIRQNEQIAKDKQHHHKKRLYPIAPLPNDGNKKRKRGNSRPPVDISVKRQRNTDAARRSRLRKVIKMETMETRVDSLKTENDRLRVRMAVLETEVSHVAEKEARNRQRLLELEAQLALVHKQLVE